MKKLNVKNLESLLNKATENFNESSNLESRSRKSLYIALIKSYGIYLEKSDDFLKEKCEVHEQYNPKNKARTILRLANNYYEIKDKKRITPKIAGHARVLSYFKGKKFSIEKAKEELKKHGVDYFMNNREKNKPNVEKAEVKSQYIDIFNETLKGTKYMNRDLVVFRFNDKTKIRVNKTLINKIYALIEKYDETKADQKRR